VAFNGQAAKHLDKARGYEVGENQFHFWPGAAPTSSAVSPPNILRIVLASGCSIQIDNRSRSRRNFFWLRAAATNELPLSGIRLRLSVSLFLLEVSQAYALRALNAGCIDGDRSLSSFGPMDCLGQYQTKVRPKEKSRPKQVIWWKQHSSALIAPLRPSTPLIGSLTIMVERRLASLEGRVGNRKNVMADHSYWQGADLASNR